MRFRNSRPPDLQSQYIRIAMVGAGSMCVLYLIVPIAVIWWTG